MHRKFRETIGVISKECLILKLQKVVLKFKMLDKFLIIAFTKSCENLHFTKFETTSIKGHTYLHIQYVPNINFLM